MLRRIMQELANLLGIRILGPQEPAQRPFQEAGASDQGAAQPQDAQPAQPTDEAAIVPPSSLWQRIASYERDHLRWLLGHPRILWPAVILIVAVAVGKKWLPSARQSLGEVAPQFWAFLQDDRVALVGVAIVLILLIFGLKWLRYTGDFVRAIVGGVRKTSKWAIPIVIILVVFGLWLANNHNTWVVLPFDVGQLEGAWCDPSEAAIQLIAELNQVGVGNPAPVFTSWAPQGPPLPSSPETLECEVIMEGPHHFTPLGQPIPLTREKKQAGSGGERLDLGQLGIGGISIPTRYLAQFLENSLPIDYRVLRGQINQLNEELEISISVRKPPAAWSVTGSKDAFDEMIEYLALRIALDEKDLSDKDIAFAMGNEAFRQARYERARGFFELADRLAPHDPDVDEMLGLSYYHTQQNEAALQAMEAAAREASTAWDSDALSPYLACLYRELGDLEKDEKEKERITALEKDQLAVLENYLKDVDSIRPYALAGLPVRGPGRHIVASGGDVIHVNHENAIVAAAGKPFGPGVRLRDQEPRQIALDGDGRLLILWGDGKIMGYRVTDGEPKLDLYWMPGDRSAGIQQIAVSPSQVGGTNLFALSRYGKIYWCVPGRGSESSCRDDRPAINEELSNARQIFASEEQLYVLDADGSVWGRSIDMPHKSTKLQRLTGALSDVREMYVAGDGTVYLLKHNGNIMRYYDDVKLIDPGSGTVQIFAANGFLYLLKSDGALWRIDEPRNPNLDEHFAKIEVAPPPETEGTLQKVYGTPQEIYVVESEVVGSEVAGSEVVGSEVVESENMETPKARTIYLLTDQGVLLQGTDDGDPQMTVDEVRPE